MRGLYFNNRRCNKLSKWIKAFILCLIVAITTQIDTSLAITGNQVASDGTYSSTIVTQKEGRAKYIAMLNVSVRNGVISAMTYTRANDSRLSSDKLRKSPSEFEKYFTRNREGDRTVDEQVNGLIGKPATLKTLDVITSPSLSGGRGRRYTTDFKGAMREALSKARVADNTSGGESTPVNPGNSGTSNTSATGTFSIPVTVRADRDRDFDDYSSTITFTVENGKIKNVTETNQADDRKSRRIHSDTNAKVLRHAQEQNVDGAIRNVQMDSMSGATCSKNAYVEALNILKTKLSTERPTITKRVTFKVVNGKWNDGSSEDKVVTLSGREGDTLSLSDEQIPSAGNKPNANHKAGSWSEVPRAGQWMQIRYIHIHMLRNYKTPQ